MNCPLQIFRGRIVRSRTLSDPYISGTILEEGNLNGKLKLVHTRLGELVKFSEPQPNSANVNSSQSEVNLNFAFS